MSGKEDVKGKQDSEKSRGAEEKIKALEQPHADAGELKKRYLLRRFWKSAAKFWGKRGERLSWVLSGALLLIILLNLATSFGMNLWNRENFRRAGEAGFRNGSVSIHALLSTARSERIFECHAGLCAHDDATAVARLAKQPPDRSLVKERPLLSA